MCYSQPKRLDHQRQRNKSSQLPKDNQIRRQQIHQHAESDRQRPSSKLLMGRRPQNMGRGARRVLGDDRQRRKRAIEPPTAAERLPGERRYQPHQNMGPVGLVRAGALISGARGAHLASRAR